MACGTRWRVNASLGKAECGIAVLGIAMLGLAMLGLAIAAQTAEATAGARGPVVTYAGALDQDGCPDCCEFSCRLTPTPTPHIDNLGRRVFERSAGRLLLIVEGGRGQSLLDPATAGTRKGEAIEPLGGFSRPGPQVLFDRPLGNGSAFVECGTGILGGVPASGGLNETQITAAMIDAACRFEWVPDSTACTRDRFGGFSTLSRSTKTQFCFQVPTAAEFPLGETVVAIQLRDRAGNLGPPEEIVIRVGTAGPTPTPTPTLIGQFNVSGAIAHYDGFAPLAGVTVEASVGASTTSDGSGGFTLSQLPASEVVIAPRKEGGVGTAVSALDAAYVLQATAGLRTLTDLQRIACDVTGNGTVSNLDATAILKQQVGLIDKFAVADVSMCGSDWAFYPFPAVVPNQSLILPLVGGGNCRPGAVRYNPLSGHASNQSFFAIPYGDCTGNWQVGGAAVLSGQSAAALRLGPLRRNRRGGVHLPLYVDGAAPFRSAVVEVAFDDTVLTPLWMHRSRPLARAMVVENAASPGRLRFAVAATAPIDVGDRPLAVLRFRANPAPRRAAPTVEILSASFDEQ